MKNIFKIGDKKVFKKNVSKSDFAFFENDQVHEVYATFALGRDAEWCCRLFVLDMKEDMEEGIGSFLTIQHHSPAFENQLVEFEATVKSIIKNEIICTYEARVNGRLIASGEQGQKIVQKEKLKHLFESLK